MHARMFAALTIVAVIGAAAGTPALAQNAMPSSASSAMMPSAMHHDAMHKDSMHAHPSMMKQGEMRHGKMMMKQDGAMKMRHHDMQQMKPAGNPPASSGG